MVSSSSSCRTTCILSTYRKRCRIGPEKGVIHLATAAVNNALWDMYARSREKPLWKLIVDMTPAEIVRSTVFRYISDVISPEEALALLEEKAAGKKEREDYVRKHGWGCIFRQHSIHRN